MNRLLSGVAIAAALMIAAPVWAQNNPSGGNSLGVPGPNPGGPGLTPYSGGGAPASPPPAEPPPGAEAAPPPTSATPGPHHRHRELAAYHHAKAMHHFHHEMARKAGLTGDTTAQLNRQELARIQTGNTSNLPAPGPAMPGK
jgi:hypothetical protein